MRFRLRSLLLFTALLGTACAWFTVKIHAARLQRENVARVRACGGYVLYDWELPQDGTIYDEPQRNILRDALGDDFFDDVVVVDFHRYQIDWKVIPPTFSDNALPQILPVLKSFPKLSVVDFSFADVTAETAETARRALPGVTVYGPR